MNYNGDGEPFSFPFPLINWLNFPNFLTTKLNQSTRQLTPLSFGDGLGVRLLVYSSTIKKVTFFRVPVRYVNKKLYFCKVFKRRIDEGECKGCSEADFDKLFGAE